MVDPTKPLTVTPDVIRSKCGWSPFEGVTFSHSVAATYVNGRQVIPGDAADAHGEPITFA